MESGFLCPFYIYNKLNYMYIVIYIYKIAYTNVTSITSNQRDEVQRNKRIQNNQQITLVDLKIEIDPKTKQM